MKKLGIIIFLALLCFSCHPLEKNCECDDNEVALVDIFKVKQDQYLALVYLDSCVACRNVKLFLQHKCQKEDIDIVYLSLKSNDFKIVSDYVDNTGVSSYQDIQIKVVPTLFLIQNQVIIKQAIGEDKIISSNGLIN